MLCFKYVVPSILDEILLYVQRVLKDKEILYLSDQELSFLKQEILDRCPAYLDCWQRLSQKEKKVFRPVYPKGYLRAYRIIVKYDNTLKKVFYPQLVINEQERKLAIDNHLIRRFLGYKIANHIANHRELALTKLACGICALLSVSIFTEIEEVMRLVGTFRMYGKKVIGVREGYLSQCEGRYFGNLKRHLNWFPYCEVNEWSFFQKEVDLGKFNS